LCFGRGGHFATLFDVLTLALDHCRILDSGLEIAQQFHDFSACCRTGPFRPDLLGVKDIHSIPVFKQAACRATLAQPQRASEQGWITGNRGVTTPIKVWHDLPRKPLLAGEITRISRSQHGLPSGDGGGTADKKAKIINPPCGVT
jgi:hypothetical protein